MHIVAEENLKNAENLHLDPITAELALPNGSEGISALRRVQSGW